MSVLADLWYLYHPPQPLVCFQWPILVESWKCLGAYSLTPNNSHFEAGILTYSLLYHQHQEQCLTENIQKVFE